MNKLIPTLRSLAVFMLLQTAIAGSAFAALVEVTTLATDNTFAPGDGASVTVGTAEHNSAYGATALSVLTTGERNSGFGSAALSPCWSVMTDNTSTGNFRKRDSEIEYLR